MADWWDFPENVQCLHFLYDEWCQILMWAPIWSKSRYGVIPWYLLEKMFTKKKHFALSVYIIQWYRQFHPQSDNKDVSKFWINNIEIDRFLFAYNFYHLTTLTFLTSRQYICDVTRHNTPSRVRWPLPPLPGLQHLTPLRLHDAGEWYRYFAL